MADRLNEDELLEKIQGMTEADFEEVLEKMKKLMREAAVESAFEGEPVHTLREALALRSERQLEWIADPYHKNDTPERGDSAAWIDAAYDALTDEAFITGQLYVANDEEWALFFRAVQEDLLWLDEGGDDAFGNLQDNGLLQAFRGDGGICVVVADEIKQIVNALLQEGLVEKRAFASLVHRYAHAAVNLYGLIPVTEFVEIFNTYNKQKLTEPIAHDFLRILEDTLGPYRLYENLLVYETFEDDNFEAVLPLLMESVMKPRYVPGRSRFLAHAEGDTEWTPQLRALEQALLQVLGEGSERKAHLIAERVALMIGNEEEVMDVVGFLNEQGISFEEEKEAVVRSLKGVYNNTRIWSLKGHTRAEYDRWKRERNAFGAADEERSIPDGPEKKKVGRNDPCPCGSGKKYKKCCGRDMADA